MAAAEVVPAPQSESSDDDDSELILDMRHYEDSSLNSIEDVNAAIEACKKAVMETEENSKERKDLVHKVIRLRIHQYALQEREQRPSNCFESRGHVFVPYGQSGGNGVATAAAKVPCQQCGNNIWVYLQSSQHCRECGYSVHTGCMEDIMRECVAQKMATQPDFILDICPERSLVSLKYCCVECDRKLSGDPMREPRLCDYTGLYFCAMCHWNAVSVTPARIVHNWDFEQRAVSQASKQYLTLMFRKPVINLKKTNDKLFAVVQELNQVQQGREKLMEMKRYLTVCRIASEKKLLLELAPRQHFVDDADHYSLQDLVDVRSGELGTFLTGILDAYSRHIISCVLCMAKGFICEICDNKDGGGGGEDGSRTGVIFPFDEEALSCPQCKGVFHRRCFKPAATECPKCARKKRNV